VSSSEPAGKLVCTLRTVRSATVRINGTESPSTRRSRRRPATSSAGSRQQVTDQLTRLRSDHAQGCPTRSASRTGSPMRCSPRSGRPAAS